MRSRRLRPWPLAAALVALLLGGGWVALRLATEESSEPASASAAVERFRALPAPARTLPPALRGRAPAPGVYVYATRGAEVSHVLGTRRHVYPPRTTITVSVVGPRCLRTRWDALATRWDAEVACAGGERLASEREEHEFAGHVDRRTYRCAPASRSRPARLVRGARWASRCAIAGTVTADRGVVVGPRTLAVAGRPVRTVLLRTRTTVSGDTTGTGTTFDWIRPGTGLVVRRVVANASTTRTLVGDVAYEERYALALADLEPRRS